MEQSSAVNHPTYSPVIYTEIDLAPEGIATTRAVRPYRGISQSKAWIVAKEYGDKFGTNLFTVEPDDMHLPEMRRLALLTPPLFQELDRLCRIRANAVLVVQTPEEMEGLFGSYSPWVVNVYRDTAVTGVPGCGDEVKGIQIVNAIDVDMLQAAKRPEMDWGVIPETQLFRFIALHEIGHVIHNYDYMSLLFCNDTDCSMEERLALYRQAIFVNEVLADRFAWSEMFPGEPLPVRSESTPMETIKQMTSEVEIHVKMRQLRSSFTLPTEDGKYVPVTHVRDGIPWCSPEPKRRCPEAT